MLPGVENDCNSHTQVITHLGMWFLTWHVHFCVASFILIRLINSSYITAQLFLQHTQNKPMLLGRIPLITHILAAICSCIFVIVPEQDTTSLNSYLIWVTRTVLKIHVLLEAVWIGDEFQRNSGLAIFTQGCAKNQIQFSVLRTKFNSPESFPSSH